MRELSTARGIKSRILSALAKSSYLDRRIQLELKYNEWTTVPRLGPRAVAG